MALIRPKCKKCGNNAMSQGRSRKTGKQVFKALCTSCYTNTYKHHKKNYCEQCGFIPIWQGQLDVDHIDGNKGNDNPENLRTLCANCHRLKTHLAKDYDPILAGEVRWDGAPQLPFE